MKMKKSLIMISLFIMLMSILVGCGGGQQAKETGSSSNTSNSSPKSTSTSGGELKGEITFWHSFTQPDRQAAIKEMVDEFVKQNPNVKVNIEVYPWAAFSTKWKTGLASKALPDISTALIDEALLMAKSNAVTPMDEVLKSMGKDKFLQKPIEMLTYNGKVIALPFYAHARVLWYNKALLDEKGITPPQTWDELMVAAQKVQSPPGLYGLTVPMSKKDYYATLYLDIITKSMGGHLLNKEGKVTLTDPKVLQAINYLGELGKKVAPPGATNHATKESNDLFQQGKIAFTFESGFMINQILQQNPELKDKFSAVPSPKFNKDDKDTMPVTDYITMVRWSQSKYPEITQKLLEFMYQKDRYVKFLHIVPGGMLPVIKEVAESKEFYDHPVIQRYKKEIEIIQDGVAKGAPIASEFGTSPAVNILKAQGVIEEMMTKIVTQNVPVDKAAKEAEDMLNKTIQELK